MSRLVIVQCVDKKIWNDHPYAGATPAQAAYTSPYFQGNKEYAKSFGDSWMVLSAKYGFIEPDFMIPCNYNITFKKTTTGQIPDESLRQQVKQKSLGRFEEVEVLGGDEYVNKVRLAFQGYSAKILTPLKSMRIGQQMSAVRHAVAAGRPLV